MLELLFTDRFACMAVTLLKTAKDGIGPCDRLLS